MNQKKAKQLRRDMKELGFDHKETKYNPGQPPVFFRYDIGKDREKVFKDTGAFIAKVQRGIPRTLAACGRNLYKTMKREMAMGAIA